MSYGSSHGSLPGPLPGSHRADLTAAPGDSPASGSGSGFEVITAQEFGTRFGPIAPAGPNSWVHPTPMAGIEQSRLWTLVQGDDNNRYLVAGLHHVSALGFVIATQPRVHDNLEVLWAHAGAPIN